MTFSISSSHAAKEVIPVINGSFSTGQWYFEGENSAMGGNASLSVVPAIRFNNRFSLIPSLETSYRGTRSAEELAGGSTLFQDTWESNVGVKAVHNIGKQWKVRERLGYRMKWFRETSDESWTNGLYDYNVYTVGGEVEHLFTPKVSVALGYDFSLLEFPNYESLESAQGNELSREFSGTNVLDTNIHLLSTRATFPLPWKVSSNMQIFYSPRHYKDQNQVLRTGLFANTKRQDDFLGTSIAFDRMFAITPTIRYLPSINYGYTTMDSNQNHYDARLTHFVGNYYDYKQNRVALQNSVAIGLRSNLPMIFDFGVGYSKRDYSDRTIQTVDGAYGTEKLYMEELSYSFGFSYPLSKNFRLRTTSSFGRSKSNNDYEAVYRYNYSNANYQFGFTYDY